MADIADRIFDGNAAEAELEDALYKAGVEWERTGWDWYDCSVELHDVPPQYRLSVEVQKIIYDAGFRKAYVNHSDKWETHYSWKGEFSEAKGWRVSYPHKRGEGEKGIWVEAHIPTWPQEWFDTGYVQIKPASS